MVYGIIGINLRIMVGVFGRSNTVYLTYGEVMYERLFFFVIVRDDFISYVANIVR